MGELQGVFVGCPYCGETIELLVDTSVAVQRYIEDCEVCCRPMDIHVRVGAGGVVSVEARSEDE